MNKLTMLAVSMALSIMLALVSSMSFAADKIAFDTNTTAVVITDPQNDFLDPKGKLHALVKDNMEALNTIHNIEALMKLSKQQSMVLAVDPLVYTLADTQWANAGVLQQQLLDIGALHAKSMNSKDFDGSGADYYQPYKKYINDGMTIKVAPHKMYGPESNDLIYQLRSRNVDTVILGGLVANLCVDSHMRALMENGFKVYVVNDAVAATSTEAYDAAIVNYNMIANGVMTTTQVLASFK